MPNYFSLTRVGSKEPQVLQQIDEDMCRHFGVPVDPEKWYRNWYNIEGLGIAMGMGPQELRDKTQGRNEIIDWLAANYEWNAWASR